jgi:hypothetical protein
MPPDTEFHLELQRSMNHDPQGTDSIGAGPNQIQPRRLPGLEIDPCHPDASCRIESVAGPRPGDSDLLGLSFGGSSAGRARRAVVDISRWFGPIDPRLDDAERWSSSRTRRALADSAAG